VIVIGAFLVTAGEVLLIMGVYTRPSASKFGFTLYFGGYLVVQVGTVLMSTCFNAMVADLSAERPEKAGKISAIYGVYGLTGATLSFIAAGIIFPVSKSNHSFYWFAAAVTIVSNVALLVSVPPSPTRAVGEEDEATAASASSSSGGLRRFAQVCSIWFCSAAYMPWRRVVASRALYYFSGGVFGALMLFFLYDCTDSTDPSGDLGLIAMASLAGSFSAAYPAGVVSDRFGSVVCVIIAGFLMALTFALMPTLSTLLPIFFIVPFYGMAQQVYNVADLAMITAVLPDPEKRARDMGGWVAVESLGGALGSLLAGFVLTMVGTSDRTVAELHDDDGFFKDVDDDAVADRKVYTREGYKCVFWPAACALVVASLILWPVRHLLLHRPAADVHEGSVDNNDAETGKKDDSMSLKEPSTSPLLASDSLSAF
jgi:MFS family permease